MVVIGIKQGPRPPILYLFFMKLNVEDLLKVSLKTFQPLQSYPFFKNAVFFKNGPKNLTKVEKLEFFFAFLVTIL